MTDRYNGFIVVLEKNIRSDDAEATINAIRQIRGVLSVRPNIADADSAIAEERVRSELSQKLWQVLFPEHKS